MIINRLVNQIPTDIETDITGDDLRAAQLTLDEYKTLVHYAVAIDPEAVAHALAYITNRRNRS